MKEEGQSDTFILKLHSRNSKSSKKKIKRARKQNLFSHCFTKCHFPWSKTYVIEVKIILT